MKLTERLGKEWVFFDGGMGTILQAHGLKAGELPETWNLSHPDEIIALNRSYFEAGCDVVNTNTFGANALKYLEEVVADLPNVKIITAHDSLAVDVARDLGVTYLVRGLRNATDFDYEANMDYFNKGLAPELETVYLIASHEVTPVSSSRVRELIYFEGDISSYVPQAVVKEVEAKRGKQERI